MDETRYDDISETVERTLLIVDHDERFRNR